MKTRYSAEYYEKNAKQFDEKNGVVHPNEELENRMSAFSKADFSEQDLEKITQVMAEQLVEQLQKKLVVQKALYTKAIENSSCLGYTTKTQETQEAHRIVTIFEYTCYPLAQFKKKYNLL